MLRRARDLGPLNRHRATQCRQAAPRVFGGSRRYWPPRPLQPKPSLQPAEPARRCFGVTKIADGGLARSHPQLSRLAKTSRPKHLQHLLDLCGDPPEPARDQPPQHGLQPPPRQRSRRRPQQRRQICRGVRLLVEKGVSEFHRPSNTINIGRIQEKRT